MGWEAPAGQSLSTVGTVVDFFTGRCSIDYNGCAMTTVLNEQTAPRATDSLQVDLSAEHKQRLPPHAHLLALAAYAALTFLLTLPIGLKLFTEVPGGGDAWQNIWNLWWVKQALINLHTNPYHTNLLYYPGGVNLYFHTLVLTDGLIGIPLQLIGLNLIATYNVILLLAFLLAGYGSFLLCHYLTGSRWASFVGGIVFAFSPYHFAHLFGHMNLVSLQWVPFYVLLLLKASDAAGVRGWGPRVRAEAGSTPGKHRYSALLYAAGAGVLFAVNSYTDWLYAIFLAIFTGIFLGWRLLAPSERRHFASIGLGWREGLVRLVVGGATALLLVSPVLFPTLAEAQKGYAQQPPRETLVYSSDALMSFIPSELHPIWGKAIAERVDQMGPYLPIKNPSERDVFLGYSVLLLAAYGVWRCWKLRQVRFWTLMAVATWLLSLGPILQIGGKSQFTAFGITVPMPYLLLYKLPLFSIMRTPARLMMLTTLALGVLVAFALSRLVATPSIPNARPFRLPRRWPLAVSATAPLLILFEFLSLPFPTVPPGWNVPIYAQIAKEPGNFALLELPIRPFGDYMAYQTIHGKPIIGGYLSRLPPYPLLDEVPALKYLQDTTALGDPVMTQITGGKGVLALQQLGVKYIIIRWWAFTPEQKSVMQAKLNVLLSRPPDYSYPADQVDVWRL